jgi:predicted DCC family thiol-disulfide oxidoreductase YuxK
VTTSAAPIMLFDGVCNVCNASVQFILKHERSASIQFASLQSARGKELIEKHRLDGDISTVVWVEGDRVFTRSSAIVASLKHLKGAWPALAWLLWVVPKPLRDLGYVIFARNRYRLFGKRDECMVPTPELRARFLG